MQKPLKIKIFVFDVKSQKQIREFEKDLGEFGVRKWLGNLCLWACNRNCSVEIVNVVDLP
jgi:hypothetical protein